MDAGQGQAGDDLTVEAESASSDNVKATSKIDGKPKTGVGASVALSFAENNTQASVANSAAVSRALKPLKVIP